MSSIRKLIQNYSCLKTSLIDLSVFRFLYCSIIAIQTYQTDRIPFQITHHLYVPLGNFDYYQISLFGVAGGIILPFLYYFSMICSAIGVFTRPFLVVSAFSFYFYLAPTVEIYNQQSMGLVSFTLLTLACIPNIGHFSIDRLITGRLSNSDELVPAWTRDFIYLLLAMGYMQASFSKLYGSGLNWLSGESLSASFVYLNLTLDSSLIEFLLDHRVLLILSANVVVLFQLTFLLSVPIRRLRPWYFFGGVIFHCSVLYLLRLNFFLFFYWNYLVIFSWKSIFEKTLDLVQRTKGKISMKVVSP